MTILRRSWIMERVPCSQQLPQYTGCRAGKIVGNRSMLLVLPAGAPPCISTFTAGRQMPSVDLMARQATYNVLVPARHQPVLAPVVTPAEIGRQALPRQPLQGLVVEVLLAFGQVAFPQLATSQRTWDPASQQQAQQYSRCPVPGRPHFQQRRLGLRYYCRLTGSDTIWQWLAAVPKNRLAFRTLGKW